MRWGWFDDEQREYAIGRPDTPQPWVNYLGGDDWCGIVTNNAGGYAFRKSAGMGRVLRYRFNAVPYDRPGRYVYLRDAEDGDFWSISWSPVQKPLDRLRAVCRHGLGYSRFQATYRDIEAELLCFAPIRVEAEVWQVSVTNRSARSRRLDAFGYAEFGVPNFPQEFNLQHYLFLIHTMCHDGIVGWHINIAQDEFFKDAFFAATAPVVSFDALRESFIGPWRDESRPLAVEQGRCSGSTGHGENGCGALQVRLELAPGETRRFAFIVGSGKPGVEGAAMRAAYTEARIAGELAALRARWDDRLAAQQVRTGDADFDRMVNVWNPYQAHTTFRWSRAASLIECGGRDGLGYRDTLQDTLGAMHTSAERAREVIVSLLKGQETRGCTLHTVQPLTLVTGKGEKVPMGKANDGTPTPMAWSDDHLWISLAVDAYVRETGDLRFLDRVVPWLDEGEATVYDHIVRAHDFTRSMIGVNGLPLALCADWNDSLNLRRIHGESVFTAHQYCYSLGVFADLAEALGRTADAENARTEKRRMAAVINARAWDGDWYMRARIGADEVIGSSRNREGRIFANAQSWAVIAGVAEGEQALRCMDALHEHLFTKYGVMLCAPPYTKVDLRVGGMTDFPPGQKENGGIFCHPNPWVVIAECLLGRGDRAWAYHRALMPSVWNDSEEIRQAEPYVYCQFVKGPADPRFGQARNPWLTGTATWAYVAATQYILGIRPTLGGLTVNPCMPAEWEGFSVTRRFRGATYSIAVRNPDRRAGRVRSLEVDGKTVPGNAIPLAAAGSTTSVVATVE